MKRLAALDRRALLAVATWRRPALTDVFRAITFTGEGTVWLTAVALLWVANRYDYQAFTQQTVLLHCTRVVLIAWAVSSVLKRIVRRARPWDSIADFEPAILRPRELSFPSSHAATSAAFYMSLQLAHHPWAPYVGAWAALVAFSRVYLGVHYLSDVLGGIVLGVTCAVLFHTL